MRPRLRIGRPEVRPRPGVLTGRHLSRRTFLRGAGAALALPWLEAMAPALRPAGHHPPALRTAFVFLPNGQHMPDWTPVGTGTEYDLPFILGPLAPLRSEVLVISGLALDGGRAHGDGAGDHARSAASFLTCAHPRKTGGQDLRAGVSIDQVIAQQSGSTTRLPSLEIGCEAGRAAGECDSGYSCAYSNNISWQTPSLPRPKEVRPKAVFARLFGDAADAAAGPEAARRRRQRRSVLDIVGEDARALGATLGPPDRRKLDDYLAAVREVEERVARADDDSPAERPALERELPPGVPGDYPTHVRLMYDLLALAFQADIVRTASFMLGNDGSNRPYPFIGVPDGHHDLSHHAGDPRKHAALRQINRWHVEHFARFLERLHGSAEDGGTILDRSLIVYGCGLSDGNAHRHDDLPLLLAGRGGRTVRPGRHLRLPGETPLANLYLSLLDRQSVRTPSFGDSTGRIEDL